MKKKIYIVKKGRRTGIYADWKKCEQSINKFPGALFHSIEYWTESEDEDENTEGSLRHAFMIAEKNMRDKSIGGFELVYQGSNKEYTEEESWKNEGFLPFGENNPDDSGILREEYDNYAIDDIDKNDDVDDIGANDSINKVGSHEKPEHLSYVHMHDNYDHTKEEEVYSLLNIPEHPHQNKPWLEILLYIVGDSSSHPYVGRYHVASLYTALIQFVFNPRSILYSFILIYKKDLYKEESQKPQITVNEWLNAACEAWENSDEYRTLKECFEKYDMEYIDFDELSKRCTKTEGDSNERLLDTNCTTYRLMKKYIKQGGHSLSDLYREITENSAYLNELLKVSGPFVNPDLGKNYQTTETKTSFKKLVMRTESIGMKLKENVIGQDYAIDKIERGFFAAENDACVGNKRKGPRSVFLFTGPSGVGKTFTAQLFAEELGLPFKRFDMSGYAAKNTIEEIAGISSFWKNAKPGVLTEYVNSNPNCVLLFDEIEKADGAIIRLFLQILDDGVCFDRYYDNNISFKDTIIIFTTNAGKQLYSEAKDENLTELPDKVIVDALEKDINPQTNYPYFPPEILSRMSAHTVIMFNHLKADNLRRVVEKDVENQLKKTEIASGYDLQHGKSNLAKTVLYSMGGSADARNAYKLAGKLINQQLYDFMNLMMQKMSPDDIPKLKKIEWNCDFTDAKDDIVNIYSGEKNGVISVWGNIQYEPSGMLKDKNIIVKETTDFDEYMKILHEGNVIFAVIDYTFGLENTESSLNIADVRTTEKKVLQKMAEEFRNIPIFILNGGKSGYEYSDREKNDLIKMGARGFIDRQFYNKELEMAYLDVCCQKVMDTLARRHQVLTYKTRKELVPGKNNIGKIEFYDLKLETAIEAEDRSSLLSDIERSNTKFSDVIGAEEAKKELEFFVKYLTNPKEFFECGIKPPKGILLYGPPGTGKTMLAKAMAGESEVTFLQTSATEFKSPYTGESEANIRRIFEKARKYAPSIIFIDEIDAIGKKRNGSETTHHTESMLNALLTEMDGFNENDSNKPVFVLAATNCLVRGEKGESASLDEALLRRFNNKIYVDLPTESEREQFIFKILKEKNITTVAEDTIHNIAERTVKWSIALLQNVLNQAFNDAAKQSRTITDDDLLNALEEYEYGEKREHSLEYYKRVAIHESGHAYLTYRSGGKPNYITIESRGSHGGYVRYNLKEDVTGYSRDEMLTLIRIALAGRVAEQVFYGKKESLNTGASDDLKRATDIAFDIVCTYGMEDDQLITLSREEVLRSTLAGEYTAKVNEILNTEMKNTIAIIEDGKDTIHKIADVLVRENRLTGKQLEGLLKSEAKGER